MDRGALPRWGAVVAGGIVWWFAVSKEHFSCVFGSHNFYDVSFGYYYPPHFMVGETGLKAFAQTHNADNQPQGWACVQGLEEGGLNWSWPCDQEKQWRQWEWGVLKRCAP